MTKHFAKFAIAATVLFSGFQAPASALSVTTSSSAPDLVSSILGPGISVVGGTQSLTGGSTSAGFFTGGLGSGIGIDTGIILTSGNAKLAEGPNSGDGTGLNFGGGGDADLASLIPGYSINDATILTFDFTTTGGDLFFNYVFGSDEYNEYVDSSFNDVFGFFLDGVNIALVPGTTLPVAIDNVNKDTNSALYNNNDPSDGPPAFDVEYDGFTDVFTASALDLDAGTHTIKLAIADAGDHILDSGVFIQGGSFSDTEQDPGDLNNPTPAPEPGSLALGALALSGALGLRKKRK